MFNFRRLWHYYLLWLVAFLALTLNVILVVNLYQLRERARRQIATTAELISSMEVDQFELTVDVDESLPLSLTVPFSDTFAVPISATVPVSTAIPFEENIEVPVNTVIPVNTQVAVPIPVLGDIVVPIPIVTSIPVSLSVDVPISRSIPVVMEIPVDLTVDVPVESEIPVEAAVPVQLSLPVVIAPEALGLNDLFTQLEAALGGLGSIFEPQPQTRPRLPEE